MTNTKSLLKKAELFEKLAVYGGRRAFHSIAQDANAFNNAQKYLSLAKDAIRDELFNMVGPQWSKWYLAAKEGLRKAPTDVTSLQEQLNVLSKIQSAFHSKKNEDVSGRLDNAATALGRYVGAANNELQKVQDFEKSLVETTSEEASPETTSSPWAGKVSKMIDPKVQQSLNELLGLKLSTDGSMGPQTATALQMYKNKYKNTKHIYDPSLYQDVIQSAKDKKMGIMREVPF